MTSTGQLAMLVAALGMYWGECGQNPVLFCYRIGQDLVLLPIGRRSTGENLPSCLNISDSCSTPSTTSRD